MQIRGWGRNVRNVRNASVMHYGRYKPYFVTSVMHYGRYEIRAVTSVMHYGRYKIRAVTSVMHYGRYGIRSVTSVMHYGRYEIRYVTSVMYGGGVQPHKCPRMPTPIRKCLLSNGHLWAKFFLDTHPVSTGY